MINSFELFDFILQTNIDEDKPFRFLCFSLICDICTVDIDAVTVTHTKMSFDSIQIFLSGFSVQIRTNSFFVKLPEDVLIRLFSNYGNVSVFAMTTNDADLIAIAKYKQVK